MWWGEGVGMERGGVVGRGGRDGERDVVGRGCGDGERGCGGERPYRMLHHLTSITDGNLTKPTSVGHRLCPNLQNQQTVKSVSARKYHTNTGKTRVSYGNSHPACE